MSIVIRGFFVWKQDCVIYLMFSKPSLSLHTYTVSIIGLSIVDEILGIGLNRNWGYVTSFLDGHSVGDSVWCNWNWQTCWELPAYFFCFPDRAGTSEHIDIAPSIKMPTCCPTNVIACESRSKQYTCWRRCHHLVFAPAKKCWKRLKMAGWFLNASWVLEGRTIPIGRTSRSRSQKQGKI